MGLGFSLAPIPLIFATEEKRTQPSEKNYAFERIMPGIQSAYIVQSCVISLGSKPLSKLENLRPPFRPIFSSKSCFKDLRESIKDKWDHIHDVTLSSEPFVKNLGQVCFNTRSLNLNQSPENIIGLLTNEHNRDSYSYEEEELAFFGYDSSFEDQRMNFLYFELLHPLFIKATLNGKTRAEGHIFLHFYPCGFIILNLAVSLKSNCFENIEEFIKSAEETRPWRINNEWKWTCKIQKDADSLDNIIKLVMDQVFQSIYVDKSTTNNKYKWHSVLKIRTREKPKKVASLFLKGPYDTFNIHDDGEYILSSRQGVIYVFPINKNKGNSLRSFWKKFTLIEFIILKQTIYESYASFLNSEILDLKNSRQNTLRKLTKEDFRRFSAYDSNIPTFLQALDRHILTAHPFYRRVYASISLGKGFDDQRRKVLGLVDDWESEVEKWEPNAVILWKKIISPIRSLLAK